MSTVRRETPFRSLGGHVHLLIHLQIYQPTVEGRRSRDTNGVRNTFGIVFALVELTNCPDSFENALLSREPHPIITAILSRFVLNLKPQTRNLR